MISVTKIFFVLILLFVCTLLWAGENDRVVPATENADVSDRTQRFYDSLESKSTRRRVPRFLYNSLFTKSRQDTLSSIKVNDESERFKAYEGKIIQNIIIERANVFDVDCNKFEKFANKVHVVTREKTVSRDLFFKSGDKVSATTLVNNEQFIKARNFIYDAKISIMPNPEDTTRVDIIVNTQDNWTLSADADINFGGRSMIELYDANVLGVGNRLSVRTNFDWKNGDYGGNRVEYDTPNILGSFYKGSFVAGKNFDNSDLGFSVTKDFILPTDYTVGLSYMDSHLPYYMLYADSSFNVEGREINAWAGNSFFLKSINSSIYYSTSYDNQKYDVRPDVTDGHNLRFHNYQQILVSLGLYREKFYTTNLIYGYGVKEYIPAGFRAELTGGYRWGEFSADFYTEMKYIAGGFSRIGYLMGGVAIGSYFNPSSGLWKQSTLSLGVRYFSNLIVSGRSRIRQFVNLSYMRGWNRGTGSDELITFDRKNGMRGFGDYATGLNRSTLSSETVVFTPWQPLGFRMTFFGFADFGLLGNDVNMFKNNFYSTFGVGVRMKNERLVFSTIQFRLGIAVGKSGVLKNEVFNVSNRYNMDKYRYLPSRPQTLPFK